MKPFPVLMMALMDIVKKPVKVLALKRLIARPIATLSIDSQERHERKEKVYRED
jgi:hypothetical protein